jgi:predicted phage baseplate assembly protein
MSLPAPDLDDRGFQDLVNEAKRLVQVRCPAWTDHNVADPGVTLIETFAYMTSQLIYRLNRVPDRLYIKFLELIGVRLLPATPARTMLTFWLSSPQESTVTIARATGAATVRTNAEDAVAFTTSSVLDIVPSRLAAVLTSGSDDEAPDRWVNRQLELERGRGFPAFSPLPRSGESMVMALKDPVPLCVVRIRLRCSVEGIGVDPTRPPLTWEAWDGAAWSSCDVESDTTGGLNRDGDVVIHVPGSHQGAVLAGRRAGWLRCRVVPAAPGQPAYTAAPQVKGMTVATIGGTVEAINAEIIDSEHLGESDGVAGQRFVVRRAPVLSGLEAPLVETSSDEGWLSWQNVPDFSRSSPEDRHFVLDGASGEVLFGPLVRLAEGGTRSYGAVPPKGAQIRLRRYAIGGGVSGNVPARTVTVLKSSIPYVCRVENRQAALGGVDAETLDEAKVRGPLSLRARGRAVTADDFEQLTREAAPDVARVRCQAADESEPGAVRVKIVPSARSDDGRIDFDDLLPGEETLQAIANRLDSTRLVGTRLLIEPPYYQGVTVVARVQARPTASPSRVENDALKALYGYLHPITGGPEGGGWPFGRPVQSGEIYGVLQRVPGVDLVEEVLLFGANPVTGERGPAMDRIDLGHDALVFSYEHAVAARRP